MRILVLQHAWVEAPGVLDDALDGDAHPRTHVHLDRGESSPPLDDFDALWVLGGPMDITDEEEHPWLRREKRVIREAVRERSLAFFGICLGHQLFAEALGGRCASSGSPEQGIYPLELTDAGVRTGLFEAFGESPFDVLQNHSTHVLEAPRDCAVLARSERTPIQALGLGPRVATVQFHLETPPGRAVAWLDDEELAPRLLASPGLAGVADPETVLREHVERGNRRAVALYRAWLRGASGRTAPPPRASVGSAAERAATWGCHGRPMGGEAGSPEVLRRGPEAA